VKPQIYNKKMSLSLFSTQSIDPSTKATRKKEKRSSFPIRETLRNKKRSGLKEEEEEMTSF
jgi:hypothetical protein